MTLLKVADLAKMRTNFKRNAEITEKFEKAILKQIQMCSNHIIIKAVKKHKRNSVVCMLQLIISLRLQLFVKYKPEYKSILCCNTDATYSIKQRKDCILNTNLNDHYICF